MKTLRGHCCCAGCVSHRKSRMAAHEYTDGSYILNNRPVQGLNFSERAPARNQEIGFIFQSFNLIGDLSVVVFTTHTNQ